MFDLVVAYRIYPGVSKIPLRHASDKFQLSRFCLESFERSLGNLSVKIFAILDGCPPEYKQLFATTLARHTVEFLEPEKVGNFATFAMQMDLLLQQTDADLVYFAEDDYFYLPGAMEEMVTFLRSHPRVDFVSPYDHPDSYATSSRLERHHVLPWSGRYWRTASSTCLTFLTRKSTLAETSRLFRSYCHGNMDCPIWLALTQKLELLNPRVHAVDLFRIKTWMKTLRWGIGLILLGRRYRLCVPMPSLATHMESTGIAPMVDWDAAFAAAEARESA